MTKGKGGKDDPKAHRPVRDNIESFAVAIALALLLKFFLIEAYQIPTSSMQPALMGDSQKGVYDRILVDKLTFLTREPKRWEVAVFKYPLHQAQNYIKRIWGLPGEWLLIQGGDVWLGKPGDFPPGHRPREILKKTRSLQEHLWLEVYDSRKLPGSLARVLKGPTSRARTVLEEQGALLEVHTPEGMLDFFQGIFDDSQHGTHPGATEEIRAALAGIPSSQPERRYPADLRLRLDLEVLEGLETLLCEIEERSARGSFTNRLEIPVGSSEEGRARVLRNGRILAEQEGATLRPGRRHRLEFWSWDGQLLALLDGRSILSTHIHPEREELLGNRIRLGAAAPGRLRIVRLRLDRDIYFTEPKEHCPVNGPWLSLGERHYLMLGDNTRQSEDSRAWRELALEDPGSSRMIRGNYRPLEPGPGKDPFNADWNPVFVPSARALVFTDTFGQKHVLRPDLPGSGSHWHHEAVNWITPSRSDRAQTARVIGVPREFIVGKGFAVFYPLNPFPVESEPYQWTNRILGRAWRLRFIN